MKMLCDNCFDNRANFHDGCTMPYCNCCGWALNLGKETMNNATDEDYLRDEAVKDGLDAFDKWKAETKFQPSTGCWIDGHWGHYGPARLVEIAQDYGFEISDLDEKAMESYRDWDQENFLDEATGEYHNASEWILMQGGLADEAEDWLNENVAQPGFYMSWMDGEFFYMNNEWWGDDYED